MTHRLAQLLAAATFILLFVGGLVTSTDSGLAVPDWPLSYGTLFPPMMGGIRFEHTHRVVAATVGLVTLILTIWIGVTEKERKIRWLSIACLGAVVLQGILGGLTVLLRLPVPISVAHACLGPIFFCMVVSLAMLTGCTSAGVLPMDTLPRRLSVGRTPAYLTLFVFVQILLGAIVRHTGQGVWLHVSWAFLVFVQAGFLVMRSLTRFSDQREILRPALFLGFLVTAEFFLGVATFVFTRIKEMSLGAGSMIFPTLHQTLGALILAMSVVLALRPAVRVSP